MLTLQPMQPQHLTQVAELHVADEQVKFVGTIDEILVNIDDKIHPHLMLADGQVVGFFLIDTLYSQQYDFAGSHISVCELSLSLNKRRGMDMVNRQPGY